MINEENEYITTYVSYNKNKIQNSNLSDGNKQYLIKEIIKINNNYLDNIITYNNIIYKINQIIILFL